ncbi:hypothetical protein [Shewanella waksmanii]|uniref:hypothetical protein n=1 Tax=Shewanella waksmanii TaxID=213783 RepID=UPI0037361264
MKNLGWLLVFIPAVCTCSTVLLAIAHYFHLIESDQATLFLMIAMAVINGLGTLAIAIRTRGNLPYLLLGNLMFFIVFVFSVTTTQHHDCAHHDDSLATQPKANAANSAPKAQDLDLTSSELCNNCN